MIDHRPLPNHQAAHYIEQVARAVDYAHKEQILHRDLKPSNIMIDTTDRAFVTDFGLAKVLGQMTGAATQSTDRLGTLAYMAPEQARDPTRAVIESDVYSLGATLYEAITGRPPFRAETLVAALEQIEKHEPPRPRRLNPALDRDLETICLKCLEKEPEGRYRSAAPPCRRPPPLPRPQADHRPPLRPDRLDQEVGPAQPVARGPGLRHGAAAVRRRHGHPDRTAEKPCGRGRAEAAQHLRLHHQVRRAPARRPSRRAERAALAGAHASTATTCRAIAATPASPASRRRA